METDILSKKFDDMDLSPSVKKHLKLAGIITVSDFLDESEYFSNAGMPPKLIGVKGFGKRSMSETYDIMYDLGFKLKTVSKWFKRD